VDTRRPGLSISKRLALAFAVLAILLVAVAVTALVQMRRMTALSDDIVGNWLPSVETVNQMRTVANELRITETAHILNTDEKAMLAIEKRIDETIRSFDATHKTYASLISSDEEARIHEQFKASWTAYMTIHAKMIDLSRRNENEQAKALLDGEGQKDFAAAQAVLEQLVKLNHDGAETASGASQAASSQGLWTVIVGTVIALSAAVVMAWRLTGSIAATL